MLRKVKMKRILQVGIGPKVVALRTDQTYVMEGDLVDYVISSGAGEVADAKDYGSVLFRSIADHSEHEMIVKDLSEDFGGKMFVENAINYLLKTEKITEISQLRYAVGKVKTLYNRNWEPFVRQGPGIPLGNFRTV